MPRRPGSPGSAVRDVVEYTRPTYVYEGGTRNIAAPGARPIATTQLPIYSGFNLTILDLDGTSLQDRCVRLAQPNRPHGVADFHEEADLRYCLMAALYHLNRLLDEYVGACRLFDEIHPQLRPESKGGNTSNPRVSYEIDALLGAARRIYEAIRKLIWKHYKRPSEVSRWRSFEKMLGSLDGREIDTVVQEALKVSWATRGVQVKEYRDCIAHSDVLNDGGHTCWMNQVSGRWRMTFKLPANPEARSHQRFDYDSGPDALTYCWQLVAHLVGLAVEVVALPKIADYIDRGP